jgi:hypothetical protein
MIIYIDIDDTICRLETPMDYKSAFPIPKAVKKVNALYDEGHMIIFWTARGTVSGIDHTQLTKQQLNQWGVKFHQLKMGKPAYDLFIDDKNINSLDWLNE